MRAAKAAVVMAVILATVAPAFPAIYINDFDCTRQTWIGQGLYDSNSNYSTHTFGRVANGSQDGCIMDFDRSAMFSWVQGVCDSWNLGPINNMNLIRNGALTMTLYVTAYDSWEASGTPPPTVFGHYFWPGVRLSKGQDWVESTATFNNADTGAPWHDSSGNALDNIYTNGYDTQSNMILNANSEQWGAANTIGGGQDVYVYDVPRPWNLDTTVAWAALTNPDVVGFQLVHDAYNKPWTTQDDSAGTIYGRQSGLTQFRPFVEVFVDPRQISYNLDSGGGSHTYLPADFNQDLKVSFADYLILEANFGKSATSYTGDANNDGKCNFADYLILEAEFGHTTTPEPATVGLLVLGGAAILRRKR